MNAWPSCRRRMAASILQKDYGAGISIARVFSIATAANRPVMRQVRQVLILEARGNSVRVAVSRESRNASNFFALACCDAPFQRTLTGYNAPRSESACPRSSRNGSYTNTKTGTSW